MILANPNFVRAVPKVWLFGPVQKDDVNIIKMFYDIPCPVPTPKYPLYEH
jgi:hypothetical protein